MAALNPFPNYPVSTLGQASGDAAWQTVPTRPIQVERELVNQWILGWQAWVRAGPHASDSTPEPTASVVGVKGDYGSGKTHLLRDALAQLKAEPGEPAFDATLVAACREVDIATWYQQVIGPALGIDRVTELIVRLLALAGGEVAGGAALTNSAVAKLQEDPTSIRRLVRDDLLNTTAVRVKFNEMMVPIAGANVRSALGGLVWGETAQIAGRWLIGQALSPAEAKQLGLTKNQADEDDAAAIISAVAALNRSLRQPFALFFDELEHLVRHDKFQNTTRNVTWLKRLLEGLADYKVLVFLAGHWTAWEGRTDFLDRLSFFRPIQVVRLEAKDISSLVLEVAQVQPAVFDRAAATQVAEITQGNIRRILSLCYVLFRESDGFARPVTAAQIVDWAALAGQRIPVDEALVGIEDGLERLGLRTRQAGRLGNNEFDLLAFREERPVLALAFSRRFTDLDQVRALVRFWEALKGSRDANPDLLGCFVVDGQLEPNLIRLAGLAGEAGLFCFDLTQPDVVRAITNTAVPTLIINPGAVAPSAPVAPAPPSPVAAREFDQQVTELERVGVLGQRAQQARVESTFSGETSSPRESAIGQEVAAALPTPAHSYSDLGFQPLLSDSLRLLIAGPDARVGQKAFVLLVCAVLVLIITPTFAGYSTIIIPLGYFGSGVLVLLAVLYIAGGVNSIQAFYNFRSRVLREIYVVREDEYTLTVAINILDSSFEQFGSKRGRDRAAQLLNDSLEVPITSVRAEILNPEPTKSSARRN
jgi:hypothetical protein